MGKNSEQAIEKNVELGVLMAYYGAFLTDRQREILSLRVDEDYSLFEIAERERISRQGVHDILHRAQTQLYDMEKRLRLVKRAAALEEGLKEIERIAKSASINEADRSRLVKETAAIRSMWEEEYGV